MDLQLFFLINRSWVHPALDALMATLSCSEIWLLIAAVAALWILVAGGFRARAMIVAAVLAIGLTDGVAVHSLKHAVGRPRPNDAVEGARSVELARARPRLLALGKPLRVKWTRADTRPARGNSFPSGHTANTFALATVVFLFYRRWGWLAYLPAAVLGYGRIYVGAHWPSDVAVACVLGSLLAVLVVRGLDALWRRFGGRWFPCTLANHPGLLAP